MDVTVEVLQRFWAKVQKQEGDGCWIWTAGKSAGYGRFWLTHTHWVYTHRFSYELVYGAIADGLHIRHRCDNPCGVNPHHLEVGTMQENMQDKILRGRSQQPGGTHRANAKLTWEQVREIRALKEQEWSYPKLAARFHVSQKVCFEICHQQAWREDNTALPRPKRVKQEPLTVAERFWRKVEVGEADACWNWKQYTNKKGYGSFFYQGVMIPSHRAAYFITHGSLPADMFILHSCDNPSCCNPTHLRAGTAQDNVDDMMVRSRHSDLSGEQHPHARLTEQQVREIRLQAESGIQRHVLAIKFHVSYAAICDIINHRAWKHTDHDLKIEKQLHRKLTEEIVREIRYRYKRGLGPILAAEYGIEEQTVIKFVKRQLWKHVE